MILTLIAKITVEQVAANKAKQLISLANHEKTPFKIGVELTQQIHQRFKPIKQKSFVTAFLHVLQPYWTNVTVPFPFRMRSGAIDLIYAKGECDSYTRALNFVLEEAGFITWQFNLVSKSDGHTISLAQSNNGKLYLFDPYFALVATENGSPLSPVDLRKRSKSNLNSQKLWQTTGSTTVPTFYENFADIQFALQGEKIHLIDTVRLTPGQILIIGRDNKISDIRPDAIKIGWHSFWDYIGSRYDRSWQRTLHFKQDTKVTIELLDKVNKRFITSNIKPIIKEKTLLYEVKAGESLVFEDGLAGRDWLHLKSYQDIDYIKFEGLQRM